MKDFAKSIRTGNAYTKGQVLGQEEGKKYVFGGEINGTYIVHRQPDGKTFSFSSEQEVKDWLRNSKIGNSKVGNAKKTFSGKYLDIYDDGQVIVKDGWAFGERFNENNFRGWIETQIRFQEHTLQTSKQMRSEFEKNI